MRTHLRKDLTMKSAMKFIVFLLCLPFILMIVMMLMAVMTALIASWA